MQVNVIPCIILARGLLTTVYSVEILLPFLIKLLDGPRSKLFKIMSLSIFTHRRLLPINVTGF